MINFSQLFKLPISKSTQALVEKKDAETIKKVFPIWWPFGKSFMVPALMLNLIVHITTFLVTGNKLWIFTGLTLFSIGPYTGLWWIFQPM